MQRVIDPVYAIALLAASAAVTALLIRLLHPWLVRYALARPNARSSHKTPTPQGGGIAVVLVVAAVVAIGALLDVAQFRSPWAAVLVAALLGLAVVGAVDDIRPLPVMPRLVSQFVVAAALVATLPAGGRIVPFIPAPLETVALVVGLVWFTNLTNFMDGIDLMTVTEVVPIALCLALVGYAGLVPEIAALLPVSLALAGAMLGFAPYNTHVARLFLGDVGSLPIGALLGWLLIALAFAGHPVAAFILALYYLADATITLARRWRNGERLSEAHRSHFYQRAVIAGMTVPQVNREVLLLNALLCALAIVAIRWPHVLAQILCLAAAVAATGFLLWRFEHGHGARRPAP
jgi:UDP-N-acetylmuramyl pentapeptide phosphotransferase/UDP-N-acetylglucosamine-1-phosphate transferase